MKRILSLLFVLVFSLATAQGGIVIPTGLKVTTTEPADDRLRVESVAALNDILYPYEGLIAFVEAENTHYFYKNNNWQRLINLNLSTYNNDINFLLADFEILTRSAALNKITTGTLKEGQKYCIIDCEAAMYGGTKFYTYAISASAFSSDGHAIFYNPKYKLETGFGIYDPLESYAKNIKTIWGGYVWQNKNGVKGQVDTRFELNSDWTLIPYNETDYNTSIDRVVYDVHRDMFLSRKSGSIEFVGNWETINLGYANYGCNPIKMMRWGNDDNSNFGVSKVYVKNSFLDIINFKGKFIDQLDLDGYSRMTNFTSEKDEFCYISNVSLNRATLIDYHQMALNKFTAIDVNITGGITSNCSSPGGIFRNIRRTLGSYETWGLECSSPHASTPIIQEQYPELEELESGLSKIVFQNGDKIYKVDFNKINLSNFNNDLTIDGPETPGLQAVLNTGAIANLPSIDLVMNLKNIKLRSSSSVDSRAGSQLIVGENTKLVIDDSTPSKGRELRLGNNGLLIRTGIETGSLTANDYTLPPFRGAANNILKQGEDGAVYWSSVRWDEISGSQSSVNLSQFNNNLPDSNRSVLFEFTQNASPVITKPYTYVLFKDLTSNAIMTLSDPEFSKNATVTVYIDPGVSGYSVDITGDLYTVFGESSTVNNKNKIEFKSVYVNSQTKWKWLIID